MKTSYYLVFVPCFLFGIIFPTATQAQVNMQDSLLQYEIAPATVTAFRLEETELKTPLAYTKIGAYRLQHGQEQLALNEALNAVPGLFVTNADNFSQDIRVSIRGFGSRSAFGIRGIKILMDGFPESSPDGQGQVDNIEPGALQSLEVIRGSSSALFGNASGGYINFNTFQRSEQESLEASASAGSFGFQKYQIKFRGGKSGKVYYNLFSSYTATNGYREQSAMKNTLLNGTMLIRLDSSAELFVALNYTDSPLAQDAGGIALEQANTKHESARLQNIEYDAGEALRQGRAGISFHKRFSARHQLTAKVYHTQRAFSNKLPLESGGIVAFDRSFSGGGLHYTYQNPNPVIPWTFSAGMDYERQVDQRHRYDNLQGIQGKLSLDQSEIFANLSGNTTFNFALSKRLNLNIAGRLDGIKITARDHYFIDGDDSGERRLNKISPLAGLVYSISPAINLYANAGSSFETPTLSELSANPDGEGGFNEGLAPQKARSVEAGLKGWLSGKHLRYDLALFHIGLRDEFVPYELDVFPGRTFYRNAATSQRTGIEAGLGAYLGKGFYSYLNYTFSDFNFRHCENASGIFNGKTLPGIPAHFGYAELRYLKTRGLYGSTQIQYVGAQFVDDGNTVQAGAYWLANVRLGYIVKLKNCAVEPFIGGNNLFNARYYSNLRVNAVGGRYYEPGAEVNYFGGVRVLIP